MESVPPLGMGRTTDEPFMPVPCAIDSVLRPSTKDCASRPIAPMLVSPPMAQPGISIVLADTSEQTPFRKIRVIFRISRKNQVLQQSSQRQTR